MQDAKKPPFESISGCPILGSYSYCDFHSREDVLVRVFQINRTNKISIYTYVYICELTCTVMETGKSNVCRVGWQDGECRCAAQVQWQSAAEFPLAGGGQSFVLGRPSTDWMRSVFCSRQASTLGRAICFTQSSPIQTLISSQNTLTETSRITFGHISGHRGPAQLTHRLTITEGAIIPATSS